MINLITTFLYYSVLLSVCFCAFSSVCSSARRYTRSGNTLECLQQLLPACTSGGGGRGGMRSMRSGRGGRRRNRGQGQGQFDFCAFIRNCMNIRGGQELQVQQGPSTSTVRSSTGRSRAIKSTSCCAINLEEQSTVAGRQQKIRSKTENVLTIKITCEQPVPPKPVARPVTSQSTRTSQVKRQTSRKSIQSLPNCFQLVPVNCPPSMFSGCCIDCDGNSQISSRRETSGSKRTSTGKGLSCKSHESTHVRGSRRSKKKDICKECCDGTAKSKASVSQKVSKKDSLQACYDACDGVKINIHHSKAKKGSMFSGFKKKKGRCDGPCTVVEASSGSSSAQPETVSRKSSRRSSRRERKRNNCSICSPKNQQKMEVISVASKKKSEQSCDVTCEGVKKKVSTKSISVSEGKCCDCPKSSRLSCRKKERKILVEEKASVHSNKSVKSKKSKSCLLRRSRSKCCKGRRSESKRSTKCDEQCKGLEIIQTQANTNRGVKIQEKASNSNRVQEKESSISKKTTKTVESTNSRSCADDCKGKAAKKKCFQKKEKKPAPEKPTKETKKKSKGACFDECKGATDIFNTQNSSKQ